MEGSDADDLAALSDVLGGKHSSVGGGLITVSLHLHTAGDAGQSLTAREIGDVDESVVEGGEDVSHAEDVLAFRDLGSVAGAGLGLLLKLCFLGLGHFETPYWGISRSRR